MHLCPLTCCHFAYDIALSRLGDSMFLVLKLSGRMGTLEECGQACLYLAAEATFTMSPESFGEVGRNAELCRPKFIMPNNILTSLLYIYSELVSSHQRFKNEMYYSFIALVSCHRGLKNEIYYTFIPLVSSHNRLKNEAYYTHSLLLCKVHLMKFRAT